MGNPNPTYHGGRIKYKHIVVLENKPQDLRAMLHNLPPEMIRFYKFHFIVDTRNYDVEETVERMVKVYGLNYAMYDGEELVKKYCKTLKLRKWFLRWPKSCKVIIPLEFHKLGKFLYIDDDVMLLKDPEPLYKYSYCSGRDTVFSRINTTKEWEAYCDVFDVPKEFPSLDQVTYNHNQLNSGVFMYTCKHKEEYEKYLHKYFNNDFVEQYFLDGKHLMDQKFLSFWFLKRGNVFVPSRLITTRYGDLKWKKIMNNPIAFHYPCSDKDLPAYRDYFVNSSNMGDISISNFETKGEFLKRVPSPPSNFKTETKHRFRRNKK